MQHCANNGEISIFRAVLRCYAPCVAGALCSFCQWKDEITKMGTSCQSLTIMHIPTFEWKNLEIFPSTHSKTQALKLWRHEFSETGTLLLSWFVQKLEGELALVWTWQVH